MGGNPRMRARAVAEVFFKEEMKQFQGEIGKRDAEIERLTNELEEAKKSAKKYQMDLLVKIEEEERSSAKSRKLEEELDKLKEENDKKKTKKKES